MVPPSIGGVVRACAVFLERVVRRMRLGRELGAEGIWIFRKR
jgi:hypothetical protein